MDEDLLGEFKPLLKSIGIVLFMITSICCLYKYVVCHMNRVPINRSKPIKSKPIMINVNTIDIV